MKISESLAKFSNARKTLANASLVALWHVGMETQVNVLAGNGEPVEGKRATYSDGINTWWNIRIPHGADSEPEMVGFMYDVAARCSCRRHWHDGLGLAEAV